MKKTKPKSQAPKYFQSCIKSDYTNLKMPEKIEYVPEHILTLQSLSSNNGSINEKVKRAKRQTKKIKTPTFWLKFQMLLSLNSKLNLTLREV